MGMNQKKNEPESLRKNHWFVDLGQFEFVQIGKPKLSQTKKRFVI